MSCQPDRESNHSKNVIAALKSLGTGSEGAENDPILRALRVMGVATTGRSEAGPPLPADDRPMNETIRRLERENRLLIDHAEMLACALGACPDCWGTIADCADCGGEGKPGWQSPDPDCFRHFVQPVVERMMAERAVEDLLERCRGHGAG